MFSFTASKLNVVRTFTFATESEMVDALTALPESGWNLVK